ncbi:MAG: tetratricopeptide repeat protein [Candidatus Cloacimonetes bacterium]|nr:tetratricopeptide repeat protein [Candidatus Cloacimonadota bacterium]
MIFNIYVKIILLSSHSLNLFLNFTIFIFLVTILCAKTFIREYNYRAGEADSKLTARAIALEQVKRILLEEIGVYISTSFENETVEIGDEVKELTTRDIEVISAGITETTILEEDWSGDNYYIKAEIDVDEDDVLDRLNDVVQDLDRTEELEESRKRADEALDQIDELNKKLAALQKENEDLKEQQTILVAQSDSISEETILKKEHEIAKNQSKIDQQKREIQEQYLVENNKLAAEHWFQKGVTAKDNGKYIDAIALLEKAMEYTPDDPRIYSGIGLCYSMMKDYPSAIEFYEKSLDIKPKDPRTMVGLAMVYDQQGDIERAKELIIEAVEKNPKYLNGLLNLAIMQIKLKNYIDARDTLLRLIQMKPRFSPAYFHLSGVYKNLGNNELALKNLKRAAELGHKKARLLIKGMNKEKK